MQQIPAIWESQRLPRHLGNEEGENLGLAKGLQSCTQWSGGPHHIVSGAARDLWEYMTNLVQFTEEDILDAMLPEPVDDWQLAS